MTLFGVHAVNWITGLGEKKGDGTRSPRVPGEDAKRRRKATAGRSKASRGERQSTPKPHIPRHLDPVGCGNRSVLRRLVVPKSLLQSFTVSKCSPLGGSPRLQRLQWVTGRGTCGASSAFSGGTVRWSCRCLAGGRYAPLTDPIALRGIGGGESRRVTLLDKWIHSKPLGESYLETSRSRTCHRS